ncbi:MAG TPA: O-antigen ligase family protein [Acidimicrobiia bacterium]|nr:O-antigen ligase family protein [Acidimicrobiia bacterium]
MTTGLAPAPPRLPLRLAGAALAVAAGSVTAAVVVGAADPILVVSGVAALAAAAAVMLHPEAGLPIIAVFAVLRLADVATDFHGAPSTFTPLVALLFAAVFVRWLTTGRRPAGSGRVALLMGPFVLVAVGSLVWATDAATSTRAAEFLLKDAVVAVIAGFLLHRASDLTRVVWTIVVAGGAVATITAAQFLLGAFGTSVFGLAQSDVLNIVGSVDDVRISGPVGDPNFYAQLLVMVFPLAYERWRRAPTAAGRAVGAWATLATGASTVFTFSRGGAVALVIVAVIVLARFRPSKSLIVGVIAAAVLVLPLLPPGYVERLTALDQVGSVNATMDASIRGRTAVVRAGAAMFMDRPLLGIGFGGFGDTYPSYARDLGIELRSESREAHNLYVEIASETGLAGIAAFAVLAIGTAAAIRSSRRRFRSVGRTDLDGIAYAIGAALVGYLLTSMFLHMAFARFVWLLVGIAVALPNVATRLEQEEPAWT